MHGQRGKEYYTQNKLQQRTLAFSILLSGPERLFSAINVSAAHTSRIETTQRLSCQTIRPTGQAYAHRQ